MTGYIDVNGVVSGHIVALRHSLFQLDILSEAKCALDNELTHMLDGAKYARLFVRLAVYFDNEMVSWVAQKHYSHASDSVANEMQDGTP